MRDVIDVLYCAPVPEKGAYVGGIASILKAYEDNKPLFEMEGINIVFQAINVDFFGRPIGNIPKISLIKSFFAGHAICRKIARLKTESIVHINTSRGINLLKDLLITRYIKIHTPSKVILSIHFAELSEILTLSLPLKWWKKLFSYVDETIFLSERTRNQFAESDIVQMENSSLLYTFHRTKSCFEIDKAANSDTKHILFLGSLDKRKGALDLLEAFQSLDDSSVVLDVCGTGDEEIRKTIEEAASKTDERIRIHGYVTGETKDALLRNASVFCLPSYGEGLPLALLESMAYGCIPVVGRVGAVDEVIVQGYNGLMIEPGDIDSIAKSIKTALCDSGAMANNAIKTSRQFTIEKNVESLCQIYREVLR